MESKTLTLRYDPELYEGFKEMIQDESPWEMTEIVADGQVLQVTFTRLVGDP